MASKLTDAQIAEIRKAFAICDKDGNGTIDAHELKTVVKHLVEEEPSDDELRHLLAIMDSNKNGVIEWTEFLDAIGSWLSEDYKTKDSSAIHHVGQKRKRETADEERESVHKRIKSFFTQFKRTSDFEAIQRMRSHSKDSDAYSPNVVVNIEGRILTVDVSSKQKLECLIESRKILSEFGGLVAALNSQDLHAQLQAASTLTKLLTIVDVFSTPVERRGVAEVIVKIFELIVQFSVVPRLAFLMKHTTAAELQWHCMRGLSYIAVGPRIGSTPPDSLLHPKQMFFKRLVIAEGVVPAFVNLLGSSIDLLREQAVAGLGAIAAYDPECRDFVLQNNALVPLCQLINASSSLSLLRKLSWTLAILCGVTHPVDRLPRWEQIVHGLPSLGALMFYNDEEVLCHACAAMKIVLPGVPEPTITRRLIQLAGDPQMQSVAVRKAALAAIDDIVRYDDKQTQYMLGNDLLGALRLLLKPDVPLDIRIEACDILVMLAVKGHIQPVLAAGFVPYLLAMLSAEDAIKWKVVKVLKYLSRGLPAQIRTLVEAGAIRVLCKALAGGFREYDSVLTEVYKHCGPSYNFEFVRDCLVALDNMVNVGEMEAEEEKRLNAYALSFDAGCIDHIRSLLSSLKDESATTELNAWRRVNAAAGLAASTSGVAAAEGAAEAAGMSIEDQIKLLLWKLKTVHEKHAATTGESAKPSRHIVHMIGECWKRYFSDDAVGQKILLKCYYRGSDVRVLEIPRNMPYDMLQKGLNTKYATNLLVTYRDEEGDQVTIDSPAAWEKAVAKHLRDGEKTLKVYLLELDAEGKPVAAGDTGMAIETLPTAVPLSSSPNVDPVFSPYRESPMVERRWSVPLAGSPPTGEPLFTAMPPQTTASARDTANPIAPVVFSLAAPNIPNAPTFSLRMDLEEIKRLEKQGMLESLAKTTHFSIQELLQLYANWEKQAVNGYVGRAEFEAGLRSIGIVDPLLIEQNFSAFDINKDGKINFREFVSCLSVIQRGSVEERLRFMFNAYDLDGSGSLTPDEVFNIFKASLISKGQNVSNQEISVMVQQCFDQIDLNRDGKLSFEEFKQAVEKNQLLLHCFIHFPQAGR